MTALSNFARAYDKFSRTYDKLKIQESTFPNKFFLLNQEEIQIGISKAAHLPKKTGLIGDRLIAIQTQINGNELKRNTRTGLGGYVERSFIDVISVHLVDPTGKMTPILIEDICAISYRTLMQKLPSFDDLLPRSVSILPIANACQARCPFCFSKASVSTDTKQHSIAWDRVIEVFQAAAKLGASRAVITGGGEPSLLLESDLTRLINEAAKQFSKVVLISNGYKWESLSEQDLVKSLQKLCVAGLSVLAISVHHYQHDQNEKLMGLDTKSAQIASTWSKNLYLWPTLGVRLICVLQRDGIADRGSLERYLDWAVNCGIKEICFKELYVSTSIESEYYNNAANEWSAEHQVSLRLVLDFAKDAGWAVREKLPWGAPVFEGMWRDRPVRVAAYTEPSLLWELTNRVCRSWNLMADGRCLASLEDKKSQVLIHELR